MQLPDESPTRWYSPSFADVVFLLVALMVFTGAKRTLLDDPGVGWHLRNIDAILAQGWFLTEDPFTEPHGDGPIKWYSNQWMGELPYWLGYQWAGLEGMSAVNAVVIGLLIRLMYVMLLREGMPWPIAFVWAAMGTIGTSCSWNARPNVFSLLFLLITARLLERFHTGAIGWRKLLWLLPLFTVWANTHGGFMAGAITLAAVWAIEVAIAVASDPGPAKEQARHRASVLTLIGAGAFCATLVNPYGVDLYFWVFQLLGDKYFMELHTEWQTPNFHNPGSMRYEMLMLLLPLLLGVTTRRPNLVELGLSVLWLHFALNGFRYVALWVVVCVPLLARSSMHIAYLRQLAVSWKLGTEPDSLLNRPAGKPGWLWSVVIALGFLGVAKPMEGTYAVHDQKIIATNAVHRFLELAREYQQATGKRPVLFHDYDWGGYVVWHGWPEFRNYIDDRNEVQGEERVKEYYGIMRANPGWEKKLVGVDLICIQSGTPLARELGKSAEWKRRDQGEFAQAVIFQRRTQQR